MRHSILFSLLGSLFLATLMGSAAPVNANESAVPERALYAAELERLTCEFRDQLKCNFRKADCYGRMKIKGFQVKVHAAAIERRTCRDECYGNRYRDGERVQELVCNLREMWYSSSRGADVACLECERARIDGLLLSMSHLADCLAGTPAPVFYPQPTQPMLMPSIEGAYPSAGALQPVAPAFRSRVETQFQTAPGASTQTVAPPEPMVQDAAPGLEAPQPPVLRSVLDQ